MKFRNIKKWLLVVIIILTHADMLFSNEVVDQKKYNIGLLVVATGKYTEFVQPLLDSANKYFCTNHNVTYFIFTDGVIEQADNIVRIEQNRLGWPYDTMMRFDMYVRNKELLKNMDYVFACDADMLFVDTVGDEIIGDLVGTLHPGFAQENFIVYEMNTASIAYVRPGGGKYYFAGGFTGGRTEAYLNMAAEITRNIKIDLDRNIIATWHDEAHLNKYFISYQPNVILSPSYCYQEGKVLPYPQRLIALDKDHKAYRTS